MYPPRQRRPRPLSMMSRARGASFLQDEQEHEPMPYPQPGSRPLSDLLLPRDQRGGEPPMSEPGPNGEQWAPVPPQPGGPFDPNGDRSVSDPQETERPIEEPTTRTPPPPPERPDTSPPLDPISPVPDGQRPQAVTTLPPRPQPGDFSRMRGYDPRNWGTMDSLKYRIGEIAARYAASPNGAQQFLNDPDLRALAPNARFASDNGKNDVIDFGGIIDPHTGARIGHVDLGQAFDPAAPDAETAWQWIDLDNMEGGPQPLSNMGQPPDLRDREQGRTPTPQPGPDDPGPNPDEDIDPIAYQTLADRDRYARPLSTMNRSRGYR